MTRRAALLLAGLAGPSYAQPLAPLIVDTDAGTDDLLAIAFLLSHPNVQIEAICVVNGLAHVKSGAANIKRLLRLAGRPDLPVYAGPAAAQIPGRAFPDEWRRISDQLPGVKLPSYAGSPFPSAIDFLVQRLTRPATVLALGPITNLTAAFGANPKAASMIGRLVIMGGAFQVPGNLGDGGLLKTSNTTAEWNIFMDPAGAAVVLGSGAPITLVPLDATSKVPIDLAFLNEFQKRVRTPLGRFASEVLESDREAIRGGYFQAWDPLAAAALVQPGVIATRRMAVQVLQAGREEGRTVEAKGRRGNVDAAFSADAGAFKRLFLSVF